MNTNVVKHSNTSTNDLVWSMQESRHNKALHLYAKIKNKKCKILNRRVFEHTLKYRNESMFPLHYLRH